MKLQQYFGELTTAEKILVIANLILLSVVLFRKIGAHYAREVSHPIKAFDMTPNSFVSSYNRNAEEHNLTELSLKDIHWSNKDGKQNFYTEC